MATTRNKPNKTKSQPVPANAQQANATDVLTLAEAAAYLRVSEDEVVRLVRYQDLPGRLLGAEWRFLKAAINDWLRTPPPRGSKEAILSVAGILKDDPDLEKGLEEIYQRRRGPMTEHSEQKLAEPPRRK